MKKLIKMLQNAHAGELAAYYAYKGHADSVSDEIAREIFEIRREELEHIFFLKRELIKFGSYPNRYRDAIFTIIGKTVSALCYVTGFYLPMYVAGLMEHVGAVSYEEMAEEANRIGEHELAVELKLMALKELEHEIYFRNKLSLRNK